MSTIDIPTTDGITAHTTAAIAAIARGRPARWRDGFLLAGPAVIASIAYMDPGNFATNIQAGAQFGCALLWVVASANLVAMLFQALSAKLGIVTGKNLAELCRERLPMPLVVAMWIVSEVAAMATDLAEFLGGAIGLSLLFRLPLLVGMGIAAVVTTAILLVDRRGYRPMELIIGGLVAIIAFCYVAELAIAPVAWSAAAAGLVVPRLPGPAAVTLAVGIIGATVMPHAIYLHSGLTQDRVPLRDDAARRRLVAFSNREVIVALTLAGLVNMAMVVTAAAAFHQGHSDVAEIETAYRTLTPLLGGAAAAVFLASLIASGLSSSVVGTLAGQMIMQGFVGFAIPVWIRRFVTMAPAFVVVAIGLDATKALVLSQVVLSFALPVPVLALVYFTRRRDVMGGFVNGRLTDIAAILATVLVLVLNAVLLAQTI